MFSFTIFFNWKTNVSMLMRVLIFGHLIPSVAMVRTEIQDETDRVTGKTKQISPIPIYLSIYSPSGRLFITVLRLLKTYFLISSRSDPLPHLLIVLHCIFSLYLFTTVITVSLYYRFGFLARCIMFTYNQVKHVTLVPASLSLKSSPTWFEALLWVSGV